ncbi:MAG: glucosidase, partial [Calditrichota bacterium]
PDSWEYPWYAAWDLAFHCIPLALIDTRFAKDQLALLTREWYMHPNGQLPAYEWAFGDVNPPVHAWATWRVYKIDQKQSGKGDIEFLERVFHKLLLNFTWWVNRKDKGGNNIFQGGFLGLDNIGVFDRSAELPTGGHLEQADGTSWMAMYSLNMMRISIELALKDRIYEDLACKFFEHFLNIALAMTNFQGEEGLQLWDDNDGFYYDQLHMPDGTLIPLKVRSLVGLIPLFAVEVLEPGTLEQLPNFRDRLEWLLENRPELAELVSRWQEPGVGERRLLSLLRGHRMKLLLKRMLDEAEFLSDYGVRGLSKIHKDKPYMLTVGGQSFSVSYKPAESDTRLFGGNSNWRGPIWFPVNYLIIESLQRFHHYYGDDFRVEYPTGSGNYTTIKDIADKLSDRLTRIFLCDEEGHRAVYNGSEKEQRDPHFRD